MQAYPNFAPSKFGRLRDKSINNSWWSFSPNNSNANNANVFNANNNLNNNNTNNSGGVRPDSYFYNFDINHYSQIYKDRDLVKRGSS